jgi:S-(hydroxymethyl)glutathione dehydrogenase/alcohol dehydrogenase
VIFCDAMAASYAQPGIAHGGASQGGRLRTRAALLKSIPGRYEICDVELDAPSHHEVLVRYVASGICHSDVHFMTGEHLGVVPMCGGHEGAGVVEAIGPGVVDLQPGDHVVASFIPSCGRCRYCAAGRANLCELGAKLQLGPQLDGTYRMHEGSTPISQFLLISTFSPWSVVPDASLVRIPKDVPLETLCLLGCGVGTGFGSAVNAAAVKPGDVVIVAGIGGVGINAVQGAVIAGAATVIAVDPIAFKRDMALKLGATSAFDSLAEATEAARSVTDGQGADAAILTMAGPTGQDVAAAFDAVSKGGTVVVTGMAAHDTPPEIPVNLMLLAGYEKRIQGCLFGMCSPAVDILRQIDLYRAGRLKLDELVTQQYPLSAINEAVDDLLAGRNIRGVIVHEH